MISKASLSDVSELNLLVNSAFRGESSKKGWTTEADLLGGIRIDEKTLQENISGPGSWIYKYVDAEGNIIGCVRLKKNSDRLYLGMLTVSPELQSKGIGKQLLQTAEDVARELQCTSIYMSVLTARPELVAWYERHGYSTTGEKMPFDNTNHHFGIPRIPLEFIILEKQVG